MAWWIFQNVVITTALAAVVYVVCRVSRLGPVASHALWVVVLVKFVTPPIVASPWLMPDPLGVASLALLPPTSSLEAVSLARRGESQLVETAEDTLAHWRKSEVVRDGAADRPPSIDFGDAGVVAWTWVVTLWAAGSLGLLLVEGIRWLRLRRAIARASSPDPVFAARVTSLAARMGFGPVRVLSLPGSGSPFIYGARQALLLWPADLPPGSPSFSEACADGLIVHELAHIKRRDHLVGWVELAASLVWWWNPLFWYVRAVRREQAELACDAWVIAVLPDGRRAYAESLLALSAMSMESPPAMAVGVRARNRRALERRLVMIMKGRTALRLPVSGLFSLLLLAAATLPTWAAGAQRQPPPPPGSAVLPPPLATPPPPPPATYDIAVPMDRQQKTAPPPPPPPPARVVRRTKGDIDEIVWISRPKALPAEGEQLLEAFQRDIEARREMLVKELEVLQDKYTKAGQLDDAIAVRDYLRSEKAIKTTIMKRPGVKR